MYNHVACFKQKFETCTCQRKSLSCVLPFTIFPLISLWTGDTSVVIKSLLYTGWTKTFDMRDRNFNTYWYVDNKYIY